MIREVHSWLMDHTILRELIFGVLLLIIGPSVTSAVMTFWRFCKIPPQRFSLWILKAQLSNAESKLIKFCKMRDDLRFFIYTCFKSLYFLVMVGILCVIFEKYVIVQNIAKAACQANAQIHIPSTASVVFDASLILIALYISITVYFEIVNAVLMPNRRYRKLESQINKLKGKIQLKEVK